MSGNRWPWLRRRRAVDNFIVAVRVNVADTDVVLCLRP